MSQKLLLKTTLWLNFAEGKARAGGEGARRYQPWMGGSEWPLLDRVIHKFNPRVTRSVILPHENIYDADVLTESLCN